MVSHSYLFPAIKKTEPCYYFILFCRETNRRRLNYKSRLLDAMHRNAKTTPARKINRQVLFSVTGTGGLPTIRIFIPLGYKIAQLPELTHSSSLHQWLDYCFSTPDCIWKGSYFSWTVWSGLKKPVIPVILVVLHKTRRHHFSWFEHQKTVLLSSLPIAINPRVCQQQHYLPWGRKIAVLWRMHQKGTLQKGTISHLEISYHFHAGNFPRPSNLIKRPFSKRKICKWPKLHISFHLQLGEGGKEAEKAQNWGREARVAIHIRNSFGTYLHICKF